MGFSFLASDSFGALTDISPEYLASMGIKLLLLDLDNTIAPYGQALPAETVIVWAEHIKSLGIRLFIASNSKKEQRVRKFAETLGVDYRLRVRKPFTKILREIITDLGFSPDNTAICGDQIFTDTLGGNAAGIKTFLVKPIKLQNIWLKARYLTEIPFRIISKGRKL